MKLLLTDTSTLTQNGELLLGANPYHENHVMYLKADISELTGDTGRVLTKTFKDGIKEVLNKWRL